MNEKWSKGEPVSLKDLLRITPLVQELIQASKDLDVSIPDLLWLIEKMAEDSGDKSKNTHIQSLNLEDLLEPRHADEEHSFLAVDEEELGESSELNEIRNLDEDEDDDDDVDYMVSVRINGSERFPEVSFRAGIADKADLAYFFEWLADMVDKLD